MLIDATGFFEPYQDKFVPMEVLRESLNDDEASQFEALLAQVNDGKDQGESQPIGAMIVEPKRWNTRIQEGFELTHLSLRHTYEIPMAQDTRLAISGHAMTRNGTGAGNVAMILRRPIHGLPNGWMEASSTLFGPRAANVRFGWNPVSDAYVKIL